MPGKINMVGYDLAEIRRRCEQMHLEREIKRIEVEKRKQLRLAKENNDDEI